MDLYIDIGNTRFKWIYSDDISSGAYAVIDYTNFPVQTLIEKLQIMERNPSKIIVASVVSNDCIDDLASLMKHLNLNVIYIKTLSSFLGVHVCYDQFHLYGVDRWLSMLAAFHYHKTEVLIADAGSAITIDLINDQGIHQGGQIALGLAAMLKSLSTCERLPAISFDSNLYNGVHFACSTEDAIQTGAMNMVVSYLNSVADSVRNIKSQKDVQLIITGGDAAYLNEYLSDDWQVDEMLVFKGIHLLSQNINQYKKIAKNIGNPVDSVS